MAQSEVHAIYLRPRPEKQVSQHSSSYKNDFAISIIFGEMDERGQGSPAYARGRGDLRTPHVCAGYPRLSRRVPSGPGTHCSITPCSGRGLLHMRGVYDPPRVLSLSWFSTSGGSTVLQHLVA